MRKKGGNTAVEKIRAVKDIPAEAFDDTAAEGKRNVSAKTEPFL